MPQNRTWIVRVYEDGEIAAYFCKTEPAWKSVEVEVPPKGDDDQGGIKFQIGVMFIPTNGYDRDRPTWVPRERVVSISQDPA